MVKGWAPVCWPLLQWPLSSSKSSFYNSLRGPVQGSQWWAKLSPLLTSDCDLNYPNTRSLPLTNTIGKMNRLSTERVLLELVCYHP